MAISTDSSLPENRVKISEDLRSINVPSGEQVLGCVGDAWVRRVWFDMPRYCDGTDLSGYDISVNYRNKDEDEDRYVVQDATTGTDTITFSWLVGPIACAYAGLTSVSIKAQLMDGDTVEKEFNSTTYFFRVLPANTTDAAPLVEYSDAFTALMLQWQSQVDTATEQAEQAAEAITDGGYVPGLLAGAADALMQDAELQDAFTLREVPDGADGVARIESIHGNTVIWNQLQQNGDFASTTGWGVANGTYSVENNVLTAVASGGNTPYLNRIQSLTANHKYLFKIDIKPQETMSAVALTFSGISSRKENLTGNAWNSFAAIVTTSENFSGSIALYFNYNGANEGKTTRFRNAQIFDLTLMFGAGNEPSTVEEFGRMFPASYYAYDTGSLLSVNMQGVNDREIPVSTYFPDGLKSTGSAYDELTATKAVKRVGVVDLGTLAWSYLNVPPNERFTAGISDMAKGAGLSCTALQPTTYANVYNHGVDNSISAHPNATQIEVYTSAYSTTAELKAAIDGVTLYYELAEPVETEISDPLNMCYRVETGGTEALAIPTGELSAPAPMVIAYGDSPDGLRDKTLAVIAAVENGVASTNYAIGAYLVHDGALYRVTRAIATGESITPGTNVTQTTVMAEVVRLTA